MWWHVGVSAEGMTMLLPYVMPVWDELDKQFFHALVP